MKSITVILMLMLVAALTVAQPKMSFVNKVHDFGTVKEDGGVVSTSFEFENLGDAPLLLKNVRATCGCTTPEWTKEPILPGKKGAVKVTYNPKNRPGAINKSVNVYSNAEPSVAVLKIKGKVAAREKTIAERFPRKMDNLRWKSNYLSLGSIKNTEVKTGTLYIYNDSDEDIKLGFHRVPSHIKARFEPEVLAPKQEGKMIIDYDGSGRNSFGYVNDRIYLTINDQKNSSHSVGVTVSINEDFSNLTPEQLAKAPSASFSEKSFDFGTIKQGEKIGHDFKLTNNGKTDLIIRRVRTTCGCTTTKYPSIVKAGEIIDLHVDFNSRGKRGRQNKTITVTTNDPKAANISLRIMGTVNIPPKPAAKPATAK